MSTTIERYATVPEAAEFLGVDGSQVRRYCLGDCLIPLPAEKKGGRWLIKWSDLRKFKPATVGNPRWKKK